MESGNLHAVTSNAVASALSYSETEQKTGGTWINGKPIYRKCLLHPTSMSFANSVWSTIFSNQNWVTTVDYLLKSFVIGYYDTEKTIQRTSFPDIRFTGTDIQGFSGIGAQFDGGYIIILEYTKTTD